MKSGIYVIKNNIDGKMYIGQSVNIRVRLNCHMNNLRKNKHQNNYLQFAFNKYGESNFTCGILELCKIEELNAREIYYISMYDTCNRTYGYNIDKGGSNLPKSEETKKKLMYSRANRDIKEIVLIKQDLANGVSRDVLRKKYNISKGNLDAIAQLQNYKFVAEELNNTILHKRKKQIDARNAKILELLQLGYANVEISKILNISASIVEKVKYKYPELRYKNKSIRIDNYNKVMALKEQGYNPMQISRITNIPATIVYRYYKNEVNPNVPLNYKKVDKKTEEQIIKLFNKYNYSEISKMTGLSRPTIKTVIDNYKYANTEVNS